MKIEKKKIEPVFIETDAKIYKLKKEFFFLSKNML